MRELASGQQELAITLPSHQVTWQMLLAEMEHFGRTSTAEMTPILLEPTASALGFVEAPPGLGDFDEGWRALEGVDYPLVDDPRAEE